MNLLDLVTKNPQIIGQVAQKFGISNDQAQSAIAPLMGSVTGALKNNIGQEGGLQNLLGALSGDKLSELSENPEALAGEAATAEGNNVLGQLFNDKEGSREVARQAAEQSGVDYGITKQILPMLATFAMGNVSKVAGGGASGLMGMISSGGGLSGLTKLLDADGDGSVVDDVMGMAGKFFKK